MSTLEEWHVDELNLQNFRSFGDVDVTFDRSLTVLVGENGAGKTAILDALAILLSTALREFGGPTRNFRLSDAREIPQHLDSAAAIATMERAFPIEAKASGVIAGEELWWRRTRKSMKGRTSWADRNTAIGQRTASLWQKAGGSIEEPPLLPVIVYYGVDRLLDRNSKDRGVAPQSRSGAYAAALDGRSNLIGVAAYMRALTLAVFSAERRGSEGGMAHEQLRAINLACDSILKPTGWGEPAWDPVIEQIILRHPQHGALPITYLSSGLKNAAGLIIDLVSRVARANPRYGAERLLRECPGIVLIDEVDLHLHPSWQQQILPQLMETFPQVQFVVTTHSPQVLSSVAARHIRVLNGDAVRGVEYSEGLRSDIVLHRVMGTRPEPPREINQALDWYIHLVDEGLGFSEEAQVLRRRLDSKLGGINLVPRLADADALMAFYDARDEPEQYDEQQAGHSL